MGCQGILWYTLNIYRFICLLYLNKTRDKAEERKVWTRWAGRGALGSRQPTGKVPVSSQASQSGADNLRRGRKQVHEGSGPGAELVPYGGGTFRCGALFAWSSRRAGALGLPVCLGQRQRCPEWPLGPAVSREEPKPHWAPRRMPSSPFPVVPFVLRGRGSLPASVCRASGWRPSLLHAAHPPDPPLEARMFHS